MDGRLVGRSVGNGVGGRVGASVGRGSAVIAMVGTSGLMVGVPGASVKTGTGAPVSVMVGT